MFHADFGGDAKRILKALDRALSIIEFEPDGTILCANENFCRMVGYELAEIKGKHHSLFVDPGPPKAPNTGNSGPSSAAANPTPANTSGSAKAARKSGFGRPSIRWSASRAKFSKWSRSPTTSPPPNCGPRKTPASSTRISRAHAVIEFAADGTIIAVNENFLKSSGYTLEKIKGQHHRILVEQAYAQSNEYQEFWRRLNRGEYIAEEYKRIAKGGKEVWIQASYNPITDPRRPRRESRQFHGRGHRPRDRRQPDRGRAQPVCSRRSHAAHRGRIHSGARTASGRFQRLAGGSGTLDLGDQRQRAGHPRRNLRDIRRPPTIFRSAPSNRPRAWKRPPPRSSRSRRR